ncbi:hypothetical protein LSCM1_03118 [Leishmania martiniquensis]|uniref:DUF1648 domain-containing protein n=1 Tax=Leishmania martiniquensis TaxID=1580590 RepID=A0A836KQD4_9TRYP|nr:hypothetical protein LSCM1_03118 [Leishmania martiniquensis]
MLFPQPVFLAVAGGGALLSVAHYFVKVRSVTGQVPVHFNLFGLPDSTAAPWAFVMYPIMSVGLAAVMMYTALAPRATAVLLNNSVEQVSARASLLWGQFAVLTCQYYAASIAEGSAERVPTPVMCALYGALAAVSAAVLATKNTIQSRRRCAFP